MGLDRMLQIRREARHGSADIYGNTLEALIGAIFLDRGYTKAEEFVHHRVLPLFIELEQSLREQTTNYKSLLLEWTQKHRLSLDFRMLQEPKRSGASFICGVYISERKVGCRAQGSIKRKPIKMLLTEPSWRSAKQIPLWQRS